MNIKKFKYKRVKSTNDIAINIIRKKNIKSGIVIAENQKKGRGQMGKKWISYKGNLFVTIFYSLDKIDLTLRELTKANVNLVIKLISYYYKKNIKLKLPNDILINKSKICGILQEKVQKNGINYLIVGIGLNLVKSPNIKEYPTTNLYELTKKKLNTEKVSKQLMLIYANFFKSKGFF
tara:strand:+ start:570 stop:1103 length:534 start_codon:yes stop_codon:yes gene_type:complete